MSSIEKDLTVEDFLLQLNPPEKCPHCGYQWKYKGKERYTNCPRCKKSMKISRNQDVEKEKEMGRVDAEWQDEIRSSYEKMYERDY